MTSIIKAELIRLVRRRTMTKAVIGTLLFSVVAAVTVFASAQTSGPIGPAGGTSVALLAGHGGGTEAFSVAASFAGFFVFVIFIALIAGEFSGGTFRALLVRDPHRLRVVIGKFVGIFLVAAALIVLAEASTFLVSLLMAPTKHIATGRWFSVAGLGAGLRDLVNVLAGVAGWAIVGTALAVIFRSIPVALAVGFAWAGPFEHIVARSWSTGYKVFPGQVLDALIRGGSAELGFGRAVTTAVFYTVIAAVVALTLVARRDVTA